MQFLHAAKELVDRQQTLLQKMETKLAVSPYDYWIRRGDQQREQDGTFDNEDWEWFFHGMECDITNLKDGRFVRVEFGPRGRTDTFTGFGIMKFVMNAMPPWKQFKILKRHLTHAIFFRRRSEGDHDRMCTLEDKLIDKGVFEPADKQLCELVKRYTVIDPEGLSIVDIPKNLMPENETDIMLCDRLVISRKGHEILNLSDI